MGPLEGPDVVGEGEASVVGAKSREQAALVGVQQSSEPGCREQSGCYNPFKDFRDCADQDDYPEGGG